MQKWSERANKRDDYGMRPVTADGAKIAMVSMAGWIRKNRTL